MFGLRGAFGKYHENKRNPKPTVEVSEEEFMRIYLENGGTEENGKFHLKIAMGLGSSVEIGDKLYQVKEVTDVDESLADQDE